MKTTSEIEAPATEADGVGISDAALTTIAGYSALAGVCPLIPLPFVDDMIIVRIHRRLYQKLCAQHEFYLSVGAAKTLTSRPTNLLSGAITTLFMWPVKKILRKLVYVLAVKSCADVAAVVFHEGWLLARALEQQYVPIAELARGEMSTVRRLRDAVIWARGHVDPKPTTQAMNSAFGVGREVFRPVLKSLRGLARKRDDDDRLDAAEEAADPIAQRIRDEITKHWSNGPALDAALRQALAEPKSLT